MSCSGCHAEIPCPGDEAFPYTLTPLAPFPWVINCPINVDCSSEMSVTMNCCGSPTTIDIPAGTSASDRITLLNQLIQQCLFLENGCDDDSGEPDDPTPAPPSAFWMNQSQTATKECSSTYGGGTYYFTVGAGAFIAISQAKANDLAYADALKKAKANAFCANPPCLCPCANVATVLNIPLTGGHGPFTVAINSGVLPTGMALSISGGIVKLTGTPTVTGLTTVTLKINDARGGYLIKTLSVYVLKISTTSLPNYTPGVFYSQQLTGTGGTGDYQFVMIEGSLPNGLSMTSGGLISGTPIGNASETFTVGMLDVGLSQVTPCTKELTLSTSPPASLIIYYVFDDSGAIFHGGGTFSQMAPDISTVPGGNDMIDDSGGIPRIVTGKLSSGWQGGYYDASGDVVGVWNYFPNANLGLTNKFSMRLWFRIDPVIYNDLGGDGGDLIIDTDSVRVSYYETFSDPGVVDTFFVSAEFFSGSAPFVFQVDSTEILVDGNWHRIIVTHDPDTGFGTIQLDDLAAVSVATTSILPAGTNGRLRFHPDPGGDFDPFPDQPSKFQICEFYLAADYVWTNAEATTDWNSGAGRTWPNVPGVP